ncbi:MAG: peptide ABC transporter substrate-binding protein [Clostridiales bacterium]|jgi:oligopeptide transport system substrate-binding protein|nr:peptide ABC transporter substrate-binding protein [Clostridiales bacterium]
MKKFIALLASLALLIGAAGACSPQAQDGAATTANAGATTANAEATSASEGAATAPAAPASEGTSMTVAVDSQFTTLDPGLNTEVVNNYAINHMYAGLFEKDEQNNAVNDLCESYEISPDGMAFTFKLRGDAVWSDGVPVTAGDFVYSYLRALSYGPDNAWAVNNLTTFVEGASEYNARALESGESFDCTTEDASGVGIKALDDRTLEIRLKRPCPYFTGLLSANVWLPVREDFAPQHESLWAFEPGYPTNGAYTLASCNENEQCVLARNPSYARAGEVLMGEITLRVMTDGGAAALAFQSGELDVALTVATETAVSYEGTDNLWVKPQCANYFLAINSGETGPEWAKNVALRRALALAIDKAALVEVLGGTLFYRPIDGYVPPGLNGVGGDFRAEGDADGFTLKYDPDQAKALLAAEGYSESNPLRITYKYSNSGIHGDVATMLQPMWKAVGVEAEFEAVESGVFYDQLDAGDFEISRYGYVASDDAIQYLELWTTAIQVVAAVNDAAFDKMVADAGMLSDPAAYYTALHAAEDYLVEENVYVIPLFDYTSPALVRTGLSGFRSLGGNVNFAKCVLAAG